MHDSARPADHHLAAVAIDGEAHLGRSEQVVEPAGAFSRRHQELAVLDDEPRGHYERYAIGIHGSDPHEPPRSSEILVNLVGSQFRHALIVAEVIGPTWTSPGLTARQASV